MASLDHAWVALCAGVVCAGPEIAAQQDVYTGFDAFFQIEQSGATCHAGPESLTAMWTNWDYASNTKNQCQRSALGAGAYVQIPKTVVGATVVLKPLPTENEPPLGMDPVITLFDFEPLIGEAYSSDGYFLEKELFHACSAPQSTTKPRAVQRASSQRRSRFLFHRPLRAWCKSLSYHFLDSTATGKIPLATSSLVRRRST